MGEFILLDTQDRRTFRLRPILLTSLVRIVEYGNEPDENKSRFAEYTMAVNYEKSIVHYHIKIGSPTADQGRFPEDCRKRSQPESCSLEENHLQLNENPRVIP